MNTKAFNGLVAKELKYYKALRVYMINKKELEDNNIEYIFPCLCDKKAEELKDFKYNAIHQAIEDMDDIELLIIQKRYLENYRITDKNIYSVIGITKDKYYQIKKRALNKIAAVLNISNIKQ